MNKPCKYLSRCKKGGIVNTEKDAYTYNSKHDVYAHYKCTIDHGTTFVEVDNQTLKNLISYLKSLFGEDPPDFIKDFMRSATK